jgi:hypothetical protein
VETGTIQEVERLYLGVEAKLPSIFMLAAAIGLYTRNVRLLRCANVRVISVLPEKSDWNVLRV